MPRDTRDAGTGSAWPPFVIFESTYKIDLSSGSFFSPFLLALSGLPSFFLLSFRVRACNPSTAPQESPAPSRVSASAGG